MLDRTNREGTDDAHENAQSRDAIELSTRRRVSASIGPDRRQAIGVTAPTGDDGAAAPAHVVGDSARQTVTRSIVRSLHAHEVYS